MLDDMGDYLSSQAGFTVGTDLTLGTMPDTPEAISSLFEVPARPTAKTMGNVAGQAAAEFAAVQFVTRAAPSAGGYQAARRIAQAAFLKLDGLPKQTLNGITYHWGEARQPPFLMGRDENKRPLISFTVDLIKGLSTTS